MWIFKPEWPGDPRRDELGSDAELDELRRQLREAEKQAEKRRILKRIRDIRLNGGFWT